MGSSSSKKANYQLNIQKEKEISPIKYLQKAKNGICQIIIENYPFCSGCFCRIPYTNNFYLNALLTCHHVLNKNVVFSDGNIKIKVNDRYIFLSLKNRKKWCNEKLNYFCIEIKDDDEIDNFYQIDDIILKNDYKNELYLQKYILTFAIMEDGEIGYSNGQINNIENSYFWYNCDIDKGYSGGVIINNKNNSIIGVNKGEHIINSNNSNINMGIFIYDIIKDIKNQNNKEIELEEKYIKEIGLDFDEYLYIEPELFEKDCLKIKYNNFLKEKNISKEKIENILYDIFENKEIKNLEEEDIDIDKIENNNEKLINIDSPLFKIISRTKNFVKRFAIYISQKIIDKYKLKDEYLKFFDNIDNLSFNYTSIYYLLDDINKINYLKEINIDFNKIKRLTLKIEENYNEEDENMKLKNNKYFFETLFSFNNIENNLVYLKINFKQDYKISPFLFDNINNFKKLEYLYINNLYFEKGFTIKLNSLNFLSINHCENIKFSENFKKLKLLDLSNNYKLDINTLEKVNFSQLKVLDLSWNKISDINIFNNINLKEVKSLYLSGNKILNIDILEKIDFKKLEKLNLSDNKILDINILEKVNFKELKELNLHHNKISDINILVKVNFKELKKLDLSCNNISDIDILAKVNFKNLKELNLSYNKILDINVLEKVNFNYLENLDLSWNNISDINILEKVNFKELKIFYLRSNNISDINILEKVNFKELKELYLSWNKISDINILEKVNFNKLEILDLSCNNILDINILKKLNFQKLTDLLLSGNNISDINLLEKANYIK